MICQNCGHENSTRASLCEDCGATIARRTLSSPASAFFSIIAGLVAGVCVTGIIWFGGTLFDNVGPHSRAEFGVSQGSAWFYLSTLLMTCAALIFLFRRPAVKKIDDRLYAFLLAALFVMLGGMSLCSLASSASLFLKA